MQQNTIVNDFNTNKKHFNVFKNLYNDYNVINMLKHK